MLLLSSVDQAALLRRSGKIDRGSVVLQLVLLMRPAEEKKRLLAYPVGIGAAAVAEGKICWRRLFTVAVKRRLSRVCRRLASGSSGGKKKKIPAGGLKNQAGEEGLAVCWWLEKPNERGTAWVEAEWGRMKS